jgi:hypothetical protein
MPLADLLQRLQACGCDIQIIDLSVMVPTPDGAPLYVARRSGKSATFIGSSQLTATEVESICNRLGIDPNAL